MPREYEDFLLYDFHDLGSRNIAERCKKIFEDFENWGTYSDVNQIVELYNLNKLIGLNQKPEFWSDQLYVLYKERSKQICRVIYNFFSELTLDSLKKIYNEIDVCYIPDFWDVFCKTKIYLKCTEDEFRDFLFASRVDLDVLLNEKYLVGKFGTTIRDYIISNPVHAEFLIKEFLQKHQKDWKPHCFPKELTMNDKYDLIRKYIDSPEPNSNYLLLIEREDNPDKLKLNSETKFCALKKRKQLTQKMFEKSQGITTSICVEFCPMSGDGKVRCRQNTSLDIVFEYDQNWIDQNLDYPTLLNNFYWFDFVDDRGRCNFVWRPSQASLVDFLVNTNGIKEYPSDTGFHAVNSLGLLQMYNYYKFLNSRGIEIEDVYKWFFEKYLLEEFGAEGFIYETPSSNTTISERNRLIATQIDHVLKQFNLFCAYGEIDREYLEFSSQPTAFRDVASMIADKYAYSNSTFLNREFECLFLKTSNLIHVDGTDGIAKCFYDLLMSKNLRISAFDGVQRKDLDFLIERGLIEVAADGFLKLNMKRAEILRQINEKEYLCLSYEKLKDDPLKSMLCTNEFRIESSLFSKPEQKYFNYILNKSEFSNGLDLRNKYIHSTYSLDRDKQFEDYMRFLIIMAIIIIKINEEFCLRESNCNACDLHEDAQ